MTTLMFEKHNKFVRMFKFVHSFVQIPHVFYILVLSSAYSYVSYDGVIETSSVLLAFVWRILNLGASLVVRLVCQRFEMPWCSCDITLISYVKVHRFCAESKKTPYLWNHTGLQISPAKARVTWWRNQWPIVSQLSVASLLDWPKWYKLIQIWSEQMLAISGIFSSPEIIIWAKIIWLVWWLGLSRTISQSRCTALMAGNMQWTFNGSWKM